MLIRARQLEVSETAPLGFRSYQPAHEFLLQIAGQFDAQVRAGIDSQRFAARPIEKELHSAPAGRALQELAHFAQFLFRGRRRKLEEYGRLTFGRGLPRRSVAKAGRSFGEGRS